MERRSFINKHNRFDFMAKADRLLGKLNGTRVASHRIFVLRRNAPRICATPLQKPECLLTEPAASGGV